MLFVYPERKLKKRKLNQKRKVKKSKRGEDNEEKR